MSAFEEQRITESPFQTYLDYANENNIPISVKWPSRLPVRLPNFMTDGYVVEFLGDGLNGSVYLLTSANERFVLKYYRFPWELKDDVKRFRKLQNAALRLEAKGITTFYVPEVEPTNDPHILKIEYLPGRTIRGIIEDDRISQPIRDGVREEFYSRLIKFKSTFLSSITDKTSHPLFLMWIGMVPYCVVLKNENVVVTSDGRLAIIDPH